MLRLSLHLRRLHFVDLVCRTPGGGTGCCSSSRWLSYLGKFMTFVTSDIIEELQGTRSGTPLAPSSDRHERRSKLASPLLCASIKTGLLSTFVCSVKSAVAGSPAKLPRRSKTRLWLLQRSSTSGTCQASRPHLILHHPAPLSDVWRSMTMARKWRRNFHGKST